MSLLKQSGATALVIFTLMALSSQAGSLPPSVAEDFYVDFFMSPPSATFVGASMRPGVWNQMTARMGEITLRNTAGAMTGKTLSHSPVHNFFGSGFPDPETTDDHERLLDDMFIEGSNTPLVFSFSGLEPGPYRVITYARHPNPATVGNVITRITVNDTDPQRVSRTDAYANFGPAGLGSTYASHRIELAPGHGLSITAVGDVDSRNGIGLVNGLQVISVPEPAPGMLAIISVVSVMFVTTRLRHTGKLIDEKESSLSKPSSFSSQPSPRCVVPVLLMLSGRRIRHMTSQVANSRP
jgi:hypothetical protein